MTFREILEALAHADISVLQGFDESAPAFAALDPALKRKWAQAHATYFGATKFTRKQADARRLAAGMPLDQICLLERKLAAVADLAERWRLRLELLRFRGSYKALSRRIDDTITTPKPTPKKQCSFSKSRSGMRNMSLTYSERDIADLEHLLRSLIDPSLPAAEQMADALVSLLRGAGGAGTDGAGAGVGMPYAAPRPIILVPLPEWTRIQSGHGDEVQLILTDGTTMTGAEFLAREFGADLEVAAFHPAEGAVNLYRAKRFANDKQRTLASMMSPTCPVPDCRHGADHCEIHHITAWRHGGETNLA
ncbi:hypothetical protein HMPREF2656_05455, partial [Corynebacterium sp. HMSC034B08]|uniref:HNH endonuclease signature motif containing protein n=1 Tax=Corynebacterium sp. HMSC034B08 TaxID=1715135 RepID=UPI0008AA59C5